MIRITSFKTLRAASLAVLLLTVGFHTACSSEQPVATEPVPTIHDGTPMMASLEPVAPPVLETDRVIRIGILLDTSGSMSGLIGQAKSQLWRIVSDLAKATVDGASPRLEIALYEYGNPRNPAHAGYVRQVAPLTTDLDRISADLFSLTTSGGDEYCGTVIQTALKDLDWATAQNDLQMMIIAGNEPFTQGAVGYGPVCAQAADRGLHINTIFCGDYDEGLSTQWRDGAVKGNGHYANIDHNAVVLHIETPYDAQLEILNTKLNDTYLTYGSLGSAYRGNQMAQDGNALSMNKSVFLDRASAKSSSMYDNTAWDLVDANKAKDFDITTVEEEYLPEEMKGMNKEEREAYIQLKTEEREAVQSQIAQLAAKREEFLAAKRKESGETLGDALVSLIRKQAEAKGFEFAS